MLENSTHSYTFLALISACSSARDVRYYGSTRPHPRLRTFQAALAPMQKESVRQDLEPQDLEPLGYSVATQRRGRIWSRLGILADAYSNTYSAM